MTNPVGGGLLSAGMAVPSSLAVKGIVHKLFSMAKPGSKFENYMANAVANQFGEPGTSLKKKVMKEALIAGLSGAAIMLPARHLYAKKLERNMRETGNVTASERELFGKDIPVPATVGKHTFLEKQLSRTAGAIRPAIISLLTGAPYKIPIDLVSGYTESAIQLPTYSRGLYERSRHGGMLLKAEKETLEKLQALRGQNV